MQLPIADIFPVERTAQNARQLVKQSERKRFSLTMPGCGRLIGLNVTNKWGNEKCGENAGKMRRKSLKQEIQIPDI
jgi:hypothetical protein